MDFSELPPTIGGRYRPIRRLDEGNMGLILEVEHTGTGERLALKLIRPQNGAEKEMIERFKREARASARIKSDYVVRVIDADAAPELSGALYLVMELLDGTDLEEATGVEPQPPALVVQWLEQVAHALDKAHRLGIIHRDLKPENLFLTRRETGAPLIKILDFGIAKMIEDAPGMTQSGQLLGTPMYMAPEQARAAGEVGPPADLYALGLITYKLLCGGDYWIATPTIAGIIAQILYEPMPPPSERGSRLGPNFDAWFAKACHRDPLQRFASAAQQIEQLSSALGLVHPPRVGLISANSISANRSLPSSPTLAPPSGVATLNVSGFKSAEPTSSPGPTSEGGPTLSSSTKDLATRERSRRKLVWPVFAAISALGIICALAFGRRDPEPRSPAVANEGRTPAAAIPLASATTHDTTLLGAAQQIMDPPTASAPVEIHAPAEAANRPSPVATHPSAAAAPAKAASPAHSAAHAAKTHAIDPLGDQK